MKKVSKWIQVCICKAYLSGIRYRHIESVYGVNRWNIQDALSKAGVLTNRIESHPRLPSNKKVVPGQLMDRYHDGDLLPPLKVNKNNPVLEDDLDIMEKMDNTDDTGDQVEGSYEMVIDENGKVRYEKNV